MKIDRKKLISLLQAASPFCDANPVLPILECAHFDTFNSKLVATNLQEGIVIPIHELKGADKSFLMPCNSQVISLLKTFSADHIDINVVNDGKGVEIKEGKSSYKFPHEILSDYPPVETDIFNNTITLTKEMVSKMKIAAKFTAKIDMSNHNVVWLAGNSEGKLAISGATGAVFYTFQTGIDFDGAIGVTPKAIARLRDEELELSISDKRVFFRQKDVTTFEHLSYATYQKNHIVAEKYKEMEGELFTVDLQQFLTVMERLKYTTKSIISYPDVTADGNEMVISLNEPDFGIFVAETIPEVTGVNLQPFALNIDFTILALSVLDDLKIAEFKSIVGGKGPAIVVEKGNEIVIVSKFSRGNG
jgi:DNA polymerase III sliding clamp (beta) subunit (PCNA family)